MSRINLKINRRGINPERYTNPVKGSTLHCKACDKEIDHSEIEDLCTDCLKYSYSMTDTGHKLESKLESKPESKPESKLESDFDPDFYEDFFDSSFESQIEDLFDSLELVDQ